MPEPIYPGIYVEESPGGRGPIQGAETSVAAFVGAFGGGAPLRPLKMRSFPEFETAFGGLTRDSEASYAVRQFFLNGGAAAWVVRVPHPDETLSGVLSLGQAEPFNLLCLPGVEPSREAVDYCRERRAMLLADAPSPSLSASDMEQWVKSRDWRDANVALYYPWVQTPDPLNDYLPRPAPPCGIVAGLYARTDAQRGVWKAPAGVGAALINAAGLSRMLSDAEQESLNALGVNCLRELPGIGRVVWGARTLSSQSEWKYVPVRRLSLFIEQSLLQGLEWAVWETMGAALCAEVRLRAEEFMHGLFRQGALQGQKPDEAYFVRCDGRAASAEPALELLVGFAALRPGEFTLVRIRLIVSP